MNDLKEKTIGEWVAADYRAAAVFKKYRIDFCCQGNRSIKEACDSKGLELLQIMDDLHAAVVTKEEQVTDYQSWPIDLLADYIEKKHHRYVEESIPVLKQYLQKVSSVHGERHPELVEIFELFNQSAAELSMHMKKEELILFPFIRKMIGTNNAEPAPHFGSVQNPVQMMMQEHDTEGERFRKIDSLSSNYTIPEDACNTFRVTYALLKEFEDDLHVHIHLENNILFPKAIELEKKLLK